MDVVKAVHVLLELQPTSVPPSGESKMSSPNRMKTLMSDNVSQADLTITTLMQDLGSSHQSKTSTEFKFLSNNFDGLRYLYDHLNATQYVEKVKFIGVQQLTKNSGPT